MQHEPVVVQQVARAVQRLATNGSIDESVQRMERVGDIEPELSEQSSDRARVCWSCEQRGEIWLAIEQFP